MPAIYNPTPLDLHNEKVRAAAAASHAQPSKSPDALTYADLGLHVRRIEERYLGMLDAITHTVAEGLGGMTVHFGACDNAAALAVKVVEGYHATVNLEHYIVIDRVDLSRNLLTGAYADRKTGKRLADRPFLMPLADIRTLNLC
jgi:hypothetical protein